MEKNSGFVKRAVVDDRGLEVEVVTGVAKGQTGVIKTAANGRMQIETPNGHLLDVAEGAVRQKAK